MTWTKDSATETINKAREVVNTLVNTLGASVTESGGTYDPAGGVLIIKLKVVADAKADPEVARRRQFESLCHLLGIPKAHYGATVTLEGKQLVLIGIRPNASKRPLLLVNPATGRHYTMGTRSYWMAVTGTAISKPSDEVM